MELRFMFTVAVALAASTLAHAHEYQHDGLHIGHPYARTTMPNQPTGAAYLTLQNNGKVVDKLIGLSSPAAKSVEIHTMAMDGNVMKMREVQNIELQPAAKVEMKPGDGYHLMLIGLRRPLIAGEKFPLTLRFEKAGDTEVSVVVEGESRKEDAVQHRH